MTMEQELQVISLVQRSPGWDRYLPNGAQIQVSFFKFPPDPSPTASEEEADPTARRQRVLPMPPQENVTAAAKFMSDFLGQYHQNCYHAIAGGFALKIRGLDRATADIDICFRGQLPALFRVLLQNSRSVLPRSLSCVFFINNQLFHVSNIKRVDSYSQRHQCMCSASKCTCALAPPFRTLGVPLTTSLKSNFLWRVSMNPASSITLLMSRLGSQANLVLCVH